MSQAPTSILSSSDSSGHASLGFSLNPNEHPVLFTHNGNDIFFKIVFLVSVFNLKKTKREGDY